MAGEKPKGKKLVYVPADLLEDIITLTRRKGESISKFVEDNLKIAVKIENLGFPTQDIVKLLEVIQVQRVLGGSFVPLDVMSHISSSSSNLEERLLDKWYSSGKVYGRYMKDRFENPVETFESLLKTMRWDLNEVGIRQDSTAIKLRCLSTSLTDRDTEMLSKFIEGAMNGMGYSTEKRECMRGMILYEFNKNDA
jgi:hypothetical protein